MELTTEEISPYLGVHFMEKGKAAELHLYAIAAKLKRRVKAHFSKVEWLGVDSDRKGEALFLTFFFSEMHSPTWLKSSVPEEAEVSDKNHHYFTVARTTGGRYLFHFSDSDVRDPILDECDLIGLASVSRARVNALVLTGDAELKAIWLQGIHRRNISKPDTKFITGENLKAAIDPLSDQSYAYNATRVNVDLGGSKISMGVNLSNSFFWMRKLADWGEFTSITKVLSDEIEWVKDPVESPLKTLSHPVDNLSDVSDVYEVHFVDVDSVPNNSLAPSIVKMMSAVSSEFFLEIFPHPGGEIAGWQWRVTHIDPGNHPFFIGTVDVFPAINAAGKVSFVVTSQPEKKRKLQLDEFLRALARPELWVVRYESGHVITSGQCFQQSYKDVDFNDFIWSDFKGYDIEKEKPIHLNGAANLSAIGADDSLFSWVLNAILRKKKKNVYLGLIETEDWLICDDGAGEIADFIHFGKERGRTAITFIHVKAANSKSRARKVSCSAYEVVLGQAIKNIRSVDIETLKKDILKRLSKEKKIWHPQLPCGKDDFYNFLNGIKGQVLTKVVVLQPHTRRTHYRRGVYTKQCLQLNSRP
ncbi:hypothetical protein [Xanthomonas campestris]|uniref:hypothetical protein n=1 Tax=Xanthomonas campestris TaxID=339 RepID=UPI001C847914|nr:hypothetical protein [Xanthomonas campestris]MEB1631915.1 hypothetical protein [Xanthomonas campestris pv. campestris]